MFRVFRQLSALPVSALSSPSNTSTQALRFQRRVHSHHVSTSSLNFDPSPESDGARIGEVVLTTKSGVDVLLDPLLNKGTGFPLEERERLGIRGLVPPRTSTSREASIKIGALRVMTRYWETSSPILKYSYLMALQDRNEVLFYRCLIDNIEELAPIIYTPTVGLACTQFNSIFRRPRGMYFSANDRNNMHAMMFNWPSDDVEIAVVTDGSRILGLGDLGSNGMGIPIGKLSLYTAAAGFHPSRTLPILLDVGTNNKELLKDPLYLGLNHPRKTGAEYDAIVDEFVRAFRERYPRALLQFEDFSNENAARLLAKYRDQLLCFNDDIQGTGCVALAGCLTALRAAGYSTTVEDTDSALLEQRIVIIGAGSAGLGVASVIRFAMVKSGLSEEEATKRFWIMDDQGLIGEGRQCQPIQQSWVRHGYKDKIDLLDVVKQVKPTIIFGLTGVPGLFREDAIREMSKHVAKPILFPLSNPTNRAECTFEQALTWTNGHCIFASGSPFAPVVYGGSQRVASQNNNMFTFPGIGLGSVVCEATKITDEMLHIASKALAGAVSPALLSRGLIFPEVSSIRAITAEVAFHVAKQAIKQQLNRTAFANDEALKEAIRNRMWDPQYGELVRVSKM